MKKIAFIILFASFFISVFAQVENSDVKKGNKLYDSGKYTNAEISYRKGLQKNPKSFVATYDLGNSLYKQKKFKEALQQYQNAVNLKPDQKLKIAAAYHNTGNALLNQKKIEQSIKAYEMALKANPKDNGTRYNLAYAQELLKKQKQDQKKNKNKKNQNKKNKKKQNKDKQNKDKNKQNKQNKNNKQQQNKNQQKKNQQQKQQQQQKQKISKQNAQQILNALMQDEKNTLDKAKKAQVMTQKSADKDW